MPACLTDPHCSGSKTIDGRCDTILIVCQYMLAAPIVRRHELRTAGGYEPKQHNDLDTALKTRCAAATRQQERAGERQQAHHRFDIAAGRDARRDPHQEMPHPVTGRHAQRFAGVECLDLRMSSRLLALAGAFTCGAVPRSRKVTVYVHADPPPHRAVMSRTTWSGPAVMLTSKRDAGFDAASLATYP